MPDQTFDDIDAGRTIDWGRTSVDYDRHRPGPPDSFYAKLQALDVGLPDQRILDLGTGTGLVARRFAAQGARVSGIDISREQIEMARAAAEREGRPIDFRVAPAESIPLADGALDVVTAVQCWWYFDPRSVVAEILRVLTPEGLLGVGYFSFMPRLDPIARASESLVLKYNPDWSGADWDGDLPVVPSWSEAAFELVGFFCYDEQVPFTRESWRGRMRALRGIAASLTEEEVSKFDAEHDELLRDLAPDEFTVCHRIHAQIFRPRRS